MDCRENDCEDVKWIELAQIRVHVMSCSGFCCTVLSVIGTYDCFYEIKL
jgi:hypothetical protein